MKKILFAIVFLVAGFCVSANSIRYFSRSQANRVVDYLKHQDEMVIYCGYEYELETYVLISDIWAEKVDPHYYEIWLFGYDAYTGEEIFMPIDLGCVWLFNYSHHRMYSAAHFLRFRCDTPYPNIEWAMPQYTAYVHVAHPAIYHQTYHYNVHVYGWRPPLVPDPYHPIHPYYMRPPIAPLPVVVNVFTPGKNTPEFKPMPANNTTTRPNPRSQSTAIHSYPANNRSNSETTSSGTRATSTPTNSSSRSNSTAAPSSSSSRSNSTAAPSSSSSRSNSTATPSSSSSRSNSTAAPSSSSSRSNSTAAPSSSSSRSNSTAAPSRSSSRSNSTAAPTSSSSRSNSTVAPSSSSSRSNSTAAPTSSSSRSNSTAAPTSSSSRSNSTAAPASSSSRSNSTPASSTSRKTR